MEGGKGEGGREGEEEGREEGKEGGSGERVGGKEPERTRQSASRCIVLAYALYMHVKCMHAGRPM